MRLSEATNITIYKAYLKTISVLNGYSNACLSISGGADSDVMLDLIIRTVRENNINIDLHFIYVDTGLEYKATKEHIKYLENKYDISIEVLRPETPIPLAVKRFGVPFISKRVSGYISRLQSHNFDFNADSFENNYKKYPRCKAALRWFTNNFGSRFSIDYNRGLREFLIKNELPAISCKCCDVSKKDPIKKYCKLHNIQLDIIGIRRAERGGRETIKSCYDTEKNKFYPLLWFTDTDRIEYERMYNIIHSECYTKYGLRRTGCVGCPYALELENELNVMKEHEPQLYKACINVFSESYDLRKRYYKNRGEKT